MATPTPKGKILTSNEVTQRNILWLPPLHEIQLKRPNAPPEPPVFNLTTTNNPPTPAFYKHPILILSRPSSHPTKVHFLLLTTFHNQKLQKRFRLPSQKPQWSKYLALAPCADHPLWIEERDPMYETLTFEGEGGPPTMRRGYVKISEVYETEWCLLENFWRRAEGKDVRKRLDERSFKILLTAVEKFARWKPGEQFVSSLMPSAAPALVTAGGPVPGPSSVPHHHVQRPEILYQQPGWRYAAAHPESVATRPPNWPQLPIRAGYDATQGEALLPRYHVQPASQDSDAKMGFCAQLWSYLKRTRLGIIVNFVSCGMFFS